MLGSRDVVSVDVGSSFIKLVQLNGSSGKIKLEKLEIVENPTANLGTNREKKYRSAIPRAIRDSLKKGHIKAKDAVSSIGGPAVIIQYFKFPLLSGQELRKAVSLEAERTVGGRANGLETDFQILMQDQKSGQQEVLFAGVPKAIVNRHVEMLQQAGLNPIAIDLDCLALANCFLRLNDQVSEGQTAVLNFGTRLISLGIVANESVHFVRDIEPNLKEVGEQQEQDVLRKVAEEVRRSIHYYEGRVRGRKVSRVYLTGGRSVASGTSDLFSGILELPVERWNPLEVIEFDPGKLGRGFEKSQGYLLSVAIGLALRESQE